MKVLLVLFLAFIAWPAEPRTENWKTAELIGAAPIAAMSDDKAARLVGSILQISADSVRFAGETYPKPTVKISKVTRSEYYRGYKMVGNQLKLPERLTVKDIGSTTLVQLSSKKAIFYWDGYFYSANRALN